MKTEQDVCDLLRDLIESDCDEEFDGEQPRVLDFEEAGLLTRDSGIVLKIGGKEFQITVVRSK